MNTPAIISGQMKGMCGPAAASEQASRRETLDSADALQMMGRAAFACAAQAAGSGVVMAMADNIEFIRPVNADTAPEIRARVVFQGRSSMTVIVEIAADEANARQASPSVTGRFLMIAVDDDGTPIPIPEHTA